jgi:hypothetical protein
MILTGVTCRIVETDSKPRTRERQRCVISRALLRISALSKDLRLL